MHFISFHERCSRQSLESVTQSSAAFAVRMCVRHAREYRPNGSSYRNACMQQQPARRSMSPSHAVRPSGLLCCGSDGLEHTARQHQRYGSVNPLFHTQSEDSSFLLLLAYQCIRGFACMRYINPRLID